MSQYEKIDGPEGRVIKRLQVVSHLFPVSYALLFFTRPPRAASCSHFESRCMLFGAAGDKNKCPIRGVLTICSQTVLRPSSKKTQIRGGRLNVKLWVVWILTEPLVVSNFLVCPKPYREVTHMLPKVPSPIRDRQGKRFKLPRGLAWV